MSASDVPETFRNAHDMARALSSYMDDASAVRRLVLESFQGAPCTYTIRRYRQLHLERRNHKTPAFKAHEGYHPADAFDAAQSANEAFLARLRAAYPERFAA